jgi:hypothetical protein
MTGADCWCFIDEHAAKKDLISYAKAFPAGTQAQVIPPGAKPRASDAEIWEDFAGWVDLLPRLPCGQSAEKIVARKELEE